MKVLHWCVAVLALCVICVTPPAATHAESGGLLSKLGCALCKVKASRYLSWMRLGLPLSAVTTEARLLCTVFGGYSAAVCSGVIVRWQDRVLYIARHTSATAAEVCGVLIESCQFSVARRHWAVELPAPSAHHTHRPPAGYGKRLKVLHLADIHLQLDYVAGSNAKCKNKLFCCRAKDGFPRVAKKHAAGVWGTYENCDTPPALLDTMLSHIKYQHPDVAYILWTGDNAAHDVHATSRRRTIEANRAVTRAIRHVFPRALVVPALGNHDTHPVNSFPPPHLAGRFSNAWLFSALYDMWRPLLDNTDLYHGVEHYHSFSETFDPLGYYYIRAAEAGLRILVVNTNYCYRYNFWTLLEQPDPGGQLQWLARQLAAAEAAGEAVHIVGHVSPGDPGCRPDWSHQYSRVVHRFRTTIVAQFFSHTHLDEFQVALDDEGRPFSTIYIAPSVSPWSNLNPGYKIYYVDDGSWAVTDTERWVTDLEAANRSPAAAPVWRRLYSARPAYGLAALTPAAW
ncbi:sphingomyelin phosphodiesterase-like [Pollicipes pollicipes]|uniref:sphingomyelin phosphodiesterase-like n=1 Tax=Pollicipes pollicipes TaxID=41117 RepID=UPI001884B828|nr:sphingomyelin phosphodiesterase-like [Pollicipes pollicipes]